MTELKALSHDEQKAAEAAFRGHPPDSGWTEGARKVYDQLALAVELRRLSLQLSTSRTSWQPVLR